MWAGGGKFDFYYSCLGKVIKNLLIYVMIMQSEDGSVKRCSMKKLVNQSPYV